MSIFYDHIIQAHHIHVEIEALDAHDNYKQELLSLIEETIHHHILHRILDKLHKDHHHVFLEKFHSAPNDDKLMEYLKDYTPDIESHIHRAADEIKYDLIKAIRES